MVLYELYALLWLVYLLECGEWVPLRAAGLIGFRRFWSLKRPWRVNPSWAHGLIWGHPWPPFAAAFVAETLPLELEPEGWRQPGGKLRAYAELAAATVKQTNICFAGADQTCQPRARDQARTQALRGASAEATPVSFSRMASSDRVSSDRASLDRAFSDRPSSRQPADQQAAHERFSPPVTLKMATARGAYALADIGRKLALETSPGQVASARRAVVAERFSVSTARKRVQAFARRTRLLRSVLVALWLLVFAALPLSVGVLGSAVWGPRLDWGFGLLLPVAGLALLLWVVGSALFVRLARSARGGQIALPWSRVFVVISSPLTLLRGLDSLARECLGDLDPAPLAAAFLGKDALACALRPRLAALTYVEAGPNTGGEPAGSPGPGTKVDSRPPDATLPDSTSWRALQRDALRALLREAGIEPQALFAPPAREIAQGGRWCPACRAQFTATYTSPVCSTSGCEAVVLQPFETAQASQRSN